MTPFEVALGFIRVANEAMCRPIRNLTQAKGHNTSRHVLACFGGAGYSFVFFLFLAHHVQVRNMRVLLRNHSALDRF
jgi:N-methylhydantoinase A/oxoprolinase/acetone carboxylase beta subunit